MCVKIPVNKEAVENCSSVIKKKKATSRNYLNFSFIFFLLNPTCTRREFIIIVVNYAFRCRHHRLGRVLRVSSDSDLLFPEFPFIFSSSSSSSSSDDDNNCSSFRRSYGFYCLLYGSYQQQSMRARVYVSPPLLYLSTKSFVRIFPPSIFFYVTVCGEV